MIDRYTRSTAADRAAAEAPQPQPGRPVSTRVERQYAPIPCWRRSPAEPAGPGCVNSSSSARPGTRSSRCSPPGSVPSRCGAAAMRNSWSPEATTSITNSRGWPRAGQTVDGADGEDGAGKPDRHQPTTRPPSSRGAWSSPLRHPRQPRPVTSRRHRRLSLPGRRSLLPSRQ